MRSASLACLRRETVRRAAAVALVVGTILNLVNHYEALFMLALTPKLLTQILLTYVVPYLVSTHGQVTAAARGSIGPPPAPPAVVPSAGRQTAGDLQ